jgi:hypothetical protein
MLHHVKPHVTVHVTLKVLYFIIYPNMLQHVTPTFKKIYTVVPFKNIGVTCSNMSRTIVKYRNFSVTCSVTWCNMM